ncbi:MAG: exodeoxyribonuclease III [Anaerolineales bacterium]
MRVLAWNMGGVPRWDDTAFTDWIAQHDADIICLQGQAPGAVSLNARHPQGYHARWLNQSAVLSRLALRGWQNGLGLPRYDSEERVLIAELPRFTLVNLIAPTGNAGRQDWFYKLAFLHAWRDALERWRAEGTSIVLCAALHIAHRTADTTQPDYHGPGSTAEERAWVDELLALGFVDSFRALHPQAEGRYTWTNGAGAAQRTDYILLTPDLVASLESASIQEPVLGGRFRPISITIT